MTCEMPESKVIPTGALSAHTFNLVSILCLATSLSLWLFNLRLVAFDTFPADPFYFADRQTPWFWIGIAFLLVSVWTLIRVKSASDKECNFLMEIIIMTSFALFFFGTDALEYSNPRYGDVYGLTHQMLPVIDDGHFSLGAGGYSYLYSYPDVVVFWVQLSSMTGLDVVTASRFYPPILAFLLALMTYAIANRFTKSMRLVAPLFLLAILWVQEFHLSALSFSIILLSLSLLVFSRMITGSRSTTRDTAMLVCVLFSIVLAHPVSMAVLLVSALASYGLLTKISGADSSTRTKSVRRIGTISVIGAVIWIAWTSIMSTPIMEYLVQTVGFITAPHDLVEIFRSVMSSGKSEYSPLPSVAQVNLAKIGITFFVGVIVLYHLVRRTSSSGPGLLLWGWIGGSAAWMTFALLSRPEFSGRSLAFVSIAVAILTAISVSSNSGVKMRKLLTVVLVTITVCSFLLPLTRNSVDPFEFRSDSQIVGREFVIRYGIIADTDYVNYAYPGAMTIDPQEILDYAPRGPHSNLAVIHTASWHNFFEMNFQRGEEYDSIFLNHSQVFDSGDFRVFTPEVII